MSTKDELEQRAVTLASVDVNAGISADVDAAVAADTNRVLMGYSVRESAGIPATVAIINGATVAGGTGIAHIELAANGSETKWFGPAGISAANGLSIDVNAGTVDVNLFYK